MALRDREMANLLMDIYAQNKKRFRLTQDEFKSLAGKYRLKGAYLAQVDSCLREDGFTIIDLRREEDCIAVVVRRRVRSGH